MLTSNDERCATAHDRPAADVDAALRRLLELVDRLDGLAIAVSGGVDSLTLATVAGRHARVRPTMFHATSAAVPPAATERVRALAAAEQWTLQIVVPGELQREAYVANPVDRCRHCKRALYEAIGAIAAATHLRIASGANVDDLADYRPGLRAAAEANVCHPFVDAGIDKAQVRVIARRLGLGAIAELPASPCLSSRVETGIRISAPMLEGIDAAERAVRAIAEARDVRCRVRRSGVVVELDAAAFGRLDGDLQFRVAQAVARAVGAGDATAIRFEPYRMGSAFVGRSEVLS